MNIDDVPNVSICPLCGTANGCAMLAGADPDAPCWCTSLLIPAEVLEKIPPEARNISCICRRCIEGGAGHQTHGV